MTLPTDDMQAGNEIVLTSTDLVRAIAGTGNKKTRTVGQVKILAELASREPVDWCKLFLSRLNLSRGSREKSPILEGVV